MTEGFLHEAHACGDTRPAPGPVAPGSVWRCRCGRLYRVQQTRPGYSAWYRAGPITWLRYRWTR